MGHVGVSMTCSLDSVPVWNPVRAAATSPRRTAIGQCYRSHAIFSLCPFNSAFPSVLVKYLQSV